MHGAGAAGVPAAARSAIFRPRIHVKRVGNWLLDIVGGPSLALGSLLAVVAWLAIVAATREANFAFAGG